jgi:hypothetical protein
VKTATILDPKQTSRRAGLKAAAIESTAVFTMSAYPVPFFIRGDRAIRKTRQRQRLQAKDALLPQLAEKAAEKGLSLFAYLAGLAPEDVGPSRFFHNPL